jgi:hypothetical protein
MRKEKTNKMINDISEWIYDLKGEMINRKVPPGANIVGFSILLKAFLQNDMVARSIDKKRLFESLDALIGDVMGAAIAFDVCDDEEESEDEKD